MSSYQELRRLLVEHLKIPPWDALPAEFTSLGLPWRPRAEVGKEKHLTAIFGDLPDADVLAAAKRVLPRMTSPDDMQDAIDWVEAGGLQRITEVSRVHIANSLDAAGVRLSGAVRTLGDFKRAVRQGYCGGGYYGTTEEFAYSNVRIARKVPVTPTIPFGAEAQWVKSTHDAFFRDWGVYGWPDARFARLLSTSVHPIWRQGEDQARVVALLNGCLKDVGLALRQVDTDSGHPVYGVRPLAAGVHGRPKNLIFASDGPKPVLGMVDAVNNDLVTLDNEGSCLVFEDDVDGDTGLTWDALVQWWVRTRGQTEDPGRVLAKRLKACLHPTYEAPFFDAYFRGYKVKLGERLPALIPQVYLHYDPRWKRERDGKSSFQVERMDFLLLLPNHVRVIIELDGIQHYASRAGDGSWKPDPAEYARTVAGDRELRLRGYEVYRFAGDELSPERVSPTVTSFFDSLFKKHQITPA